MQEAPKVICDANTNAPVRIGLSCADWPGEPDAGPDVRDASSTSFQAHAAHFRFSPPIPDMSLRRVAQRPNRRLTRDEARRIAKNGNDRRANGSRPRPSSPSSSAKGSSANDVADCLTKSPRRRRHRRTGRLSATRGSRSGSSCGLGSRSGPTGCCASCGDSKVFRETRSRLTKSPDRETGRGFFLCPHGGRSDDATFRSRVCC
jgi:hypothetical protein